jgi:hypothetical protein
MDLLHNVSPAKEHALGRKMKILSLMLIKTFRNRQEMNIYEIERIPCYSPVRREKRNNDDRQHLLLPLEYSLVPTVHLQALKHTHTGSYIVTLPVHCHF